MVCTHDTDDFEGTPRNGKTQRANLGGRDFYGTPIGSFRDRD